jgi:hypothetical protein
VQQDNEPEEKLAASDTPLPCNRAVVIPVNRSLQRRGCAEIVKTCDGCGSERWLIYGATYNPLVPLPWSPRPGGFKRVKEPRPGTGSRGRGAARRNVTTPSLSGNYALGVGERRERLRQPFGPGVPGESWPSRLLCHSSDHPSLSMAALWLDTWAVCWPRGPVSGGSPTR